MKLKLCLLLSLWMDFTGVSAQSANRLLHEVYAKMQQAKDYVVEVKIKSDIPMIKILPVNAKIYFKQENQVKVESKSIVILPKQGLNDFQSTIKDTNSFTAVITGKESLQSVMTEVINIIPLQPDGDLILGKFWVDPQKKLVLRSQLTTRESGTIQINYFYGRQEKYGLPDSLIFTIDVKKFKIPKGMATDLHNKDPKPAEEKKQGKQGNIYVGMKNYRINLGISDEVFKKK